MYYFGAETIEEVGYAAWVFVSPKQLPTKRPKILQNHHIIAAEVDNPQILNLHILSCKGRMLPPPPQKSAKSPIANFPV